MFGRSTARRIKPLNCFSVRRFLQSALRRRLGIAVESRSADLIDVLGEEVIRFVQKVELLRDGSGPVRETLHSFFAERTIFVSALFANLNQMATFEMSRVMLWHWGCDSG